MLNQTFFQKIKDQFQEAEKERMEIQKFSSQALHSAKRAIFAFHRDDNKGGAALLAESLADIKNAAKAGERGALMTEGIFKAALEEYSEAELFRQFLAREKIGAVKGIEVNLETYLGGLTDLVGEILRFAIRQATDRRFDEVKRAQKAIDEIMAELIELNLTGYLRTKYDQAKQARRKLEQMAYEISLRK